MKRPIQCSVLWVLLFNSLSLGQIVYLNDFESGVGSEWNSNKITQAPFGESFLGDWANGTISLSVGTGSPVYGNGLPAHNTATIEFDLYIIYSMDGNWGDIWTLSVEGGPTLLNTSFSNPLGSAVTPQSYPGNYPSSYPAQTGAAGINTLGYNTVWNGYINPIFGDSTYHLAYSFNHFGDQIKFNFSGNGMGDIIEESWGIDNLSVSVVPEPATFGLLAMGSICMFRRKSKHYSLPKASFRAAQTVSTSC